MKRTICTSLLLTAFLATSTQAVTWSFNFESLDESMDTWGPESPPVATGAVEYDYQWELTQADIKLEGGDLPPGQYAWIPILSSMLPEVISGSGTKASLPFVLNPINIDEPYITATLFLNVFPDGTAGGSLGNITFGTIGNDPVFDITGVRIAGDFTVTPEPASFILLGLSGLALLRKRRK